MNTSIQPVAVFPGTANTLTIRSITLGPPPSYFYQLENVDAEGVVTVLKDGNVNMTEAQWQNWGANLGPQGDDEYQLNCISANLGLTRV